jgi:hypothetical protein
MPTSETTHEQRHAELATATFTVDEVIESSAARGRAEAAARFAGNLSAKAALAEAQRRSQRKKLTDAHRRAREQEEAELAAAQAGGGPAGAA